MPVSKPIVYVCVRINACVPHLECYITVELKSCVHGGGGGGGVRWTQMDTFRLQSICSSLNLKLAPLMRLPRASVVRCYYCGVCKQVLDLIDSIPDGVLLVNQGLECFVCAKLLDQMTVVIGQCASSIGKMAFACCIQNTMKRRFNT